MKSLWMAILIGAVIVSVPAGAVWQDSYVFPDEDTVTALWVCSETSVYAGMQSGRIYHWDGSDWMAEDSPFEYAIDNIDGADDTFLVANAGGRFCWRDNGVWNEIEMDLFDSLSSVTGNSRDHFYISVYGDIRKFQDGQWVHFVEYTEPSTGCKKLHLTRENDLYMTGNDYECYWVNVPVVDIWVWLCFPGLDTCHKLVGNRMEPFLRSDSERSVNLIGGYSTEDLFIDSSERRQNTIDYRIVHHNGEFFTRVANGLVSARTYGTTQDDGTLFYIGSNWIVVWDGTVPKLIPAMPDSVDFGYVFDGKRNSDFWITAGDSSLRHWVGPLPEVPAATGAFLKMDDYRVHAGERFHVQVAAGNATDAVLTGDVYACMMIFGMNGLWFWPNWTKSPNLIEPVHVTLDPHSFQYFDVFDMVWPDIDASFDGLFHSIMVTGTGEITELQSIGFSVR
ncbi:hypothetical protein JW823_04615 [bacterium]|nr:hypothetical protein [candidate division CSSED10-310 bacterium]